MVARITGLVLLCLATHAVAKPVKLTPAQKRAIAAICAEAKATKHLPTGCASREQLAADLCGIAMHESTLCATARNKYGAKGCFQFMPGTLRLCNAKGWGRGDWRSNAGISARNTIRLANANIAKYGGTWDDAILAHNIGGPKALKARNLTSKKRALYLARQDKGHARSYVARVKAKADVLRPVVRRYFAEVE